MLLLLLLHNFCICSFASTSPAPVSHCVSRYHVMEPLNDDRADILMSYLEELERRGPPPPPTASEPGRRK